MMGDLLRTMHRLCARGVPFARVSILHQDGSTPRTAGAAMLVLPDWTTHGTVGGGSMEAEAMQRAVAALGSGKAETVRFDLRSGSGEDMICGGCLEILVEPVDICASGPVLAEASRLLESGRTFALCTVLSGSQGRLEVARCLADDTGALLARTPGGDFGGLAQVLAGAGREPFWFVEREGARWLVERFSAPETLYLFGGGHVALATARVAAIAGFEIVVVDDRPEFADPERFPMARCQVAAPGFDRVFELPLLAGRFDPQTAFVAILTRGHRHDAAVLAQALAAGPRYVGMIGSARKREAVYAELRRAGVAAGELARVHCPIGLDIGAQTPEEIAVSVVAELIRERGRA